LKILHRRESRALARLENEAFALRKLTHSSIPKLYHYGKEPSDHIALELIADGISLRRLRQSQPEVFSSGAVMRLIKKLLEVLDYIHKEGVHHRDIKDDNVLVNAALDNAWLVDFGFCRAAGQPQEPRTWGDVGANLYSPPSKLEHPAQDSPSHDVFAVGVLAYLLLAGRYPWYAEGPEADRGALLDLLKTVKPPPLLSLLPAIPRSLAKFVEDLINVNDDMRPDANQALKRFQEIEVFKLPADVTKSIYQAVRARCTRVFRDPLHGDIRLTEFEWSALNTPELQRLGYLKQLGTTHYVYRGALHTRLLHSIGTLHLIERIMIAAEDVYGDTVDDEMRLLARIYALVHDATHIPFGHTFEDELALFQPHDKNWNRAERLLGDKTSLGKLLRTTSYGRTCLRYFTEAPTDARVRLAEEMLASPVGADVLDYLDRDALACGLDERIDSAIFRRFRIVRAGPGLDQLKPSVAGKHGLRLDAASAFSRVFAHRYYLYEKVYCHRVKICIGAMLGKGIWLASLPSSVGGQPLITEARLEKVGDEELLLLLRDYGDKNVSKLAKRVIEREPFTAVFAGTVMHEKDIVHTEVSERLNEIKAKLKDKTTSSSGGGDFDGDITTPFGRAKFEEKVARIAKKGVRPEDLIVYLTPEPPGYRRLQDYKSLFGIDPSIENDFADIRRRHVRLWKLYLFTSKTTFPVASRLSEVVEDLTGLVNELPDIPRTPRLV
jgi:HD superfamily phosphohydrolase